MLSVRPKITELHFHLFARSIHPELFDQCASRCFQRDNYQLKVNVTSAGHLLTFEHDGHILTEVSTSAHHPLPKNRLVLSELVDKPKSRSTTFRDAIEYSSEFQFESVKPTTFVTIQQQLDKQLQMEGLVHRFQSNGRISFGAVSYINVQSFRAHVVVRSFHTFPDTCAVMKSQCCFRVLNPAPIV